MKAQSISSLRAAVCAAAFAAWFPACLPDGTSPELPISTAGAGGGSSGSAAGSGLAGSTGGSTAGRGATGGAGAGGKAGGGGAAGRSMTPTGTAGSGESGAAGMATAGRSGMGGAGASGMMSTAGRMAAGAGGTGGAGGAAGGGAGGMGGMGGMGGAGGAAGGGNTTAATFTQVYGLIMAGCGCHVTGTSGGLAMPNKMTAYTNLVGANSGACSGQKRVVASDPSNSVLFHAIDRSKLGNCTPPAMPGGGMAKWSQADIDKVKSWIMAGAMNN